MKNEKLRIVEELLSTEKTAEAKKFSMKSSRKKRLNIGC